MSVFLLLAGFYFFGESADWWDIYNGVDRVDGDKVAGWIALGLFAASFIAWGIETIARAIREKS